jgi:transportin-3
MEQLESYLVVVKQIEPLPITCKDTAGQVYDVMDQLFAKFYTSYSISDRLCRLLRRGINFFPYDRLHDLLPRVLGRLASCFEASGHAAYIWIIGHIASVYGKEVGPLNLQTGNQVELALVSALERTTAQTKQLEAAMSAEAIPDGEPV